MFRHYWRYNTDNAASAAAGRWVYNDTLNGNNRDFERFGIDTRLQQRRFSLQGAEVLVQSSQFLPQRGHVLGRQRQLVCRRGEMRQVDLLGLVVEDRPLHRSLEELVGVPAEELVERVLARDEDGEAGPRAALRRAVRSLSEWRDFATPWRRDPLDRRVRVRRHSSMSLSGISLVSVLLLGKCSANTSPFM